ncbi:hypothetical protein PVL29_019858 [Vitis rotundifolia]|uniref:BCD1 alpha/beta domain-containing protein n=1 Tax=Vitis rotundifolia TaxID=103349 RepID=A0AA39DD75_VITRO|nr:hypothetical protein PVL29_019858 [Vitis rotundifolia]
MTSTFHPWKNEKTHLQQLKTLKHPPLCKERKLNLSKYTCPGCSVRSGSLPCVEAHKQHTRCTGKRVNENSTLSFVIENHLKPGPWNHKLELFCAEQLDCLKFFIHKYLKGRRSPFHEFDIRAPMRQELVNLVILEYPLIRVFLPSHSYDINVIKEANKLRSSPHEKEPGENMDFDFDFDFDQGLLDVYSDIIA